MTPKRAEQTKHNSSESSPDRGAESRGREERKRKEKKAEWFVGSVGFTPVSGCLNQHGEGVRHPANVTTDFTPAAYFQWAMSSTKPREILMANHGDLESPN